MTKLSINCEKILLRVYFNFEGKGEKIFEPSIIIINKCIIIINAYYNYIA